jgi:hypothetical protein
MAGQQITWQASEYEAVARTAAIFTKTPMLKPAKRLCPGWDAEVFGCSPQEYVGTAQLVWASAIKCAGRFDLALFDTPDGELIARHLNRETVTRVLDAHLATSTAQFRAANEEAAGRAGRDGRLRRFTYNPLRDPSAHRVRHGVGAQCGDSAHRLPVVGCEPLAVAAHAARLRTGAGGSR